MAMHCCLAKVYENVNKPEASGEVDKIIILQSILANYKLLIIRGSMIDVPLVLAIMLGNVNKSD